MKKPKVLFFDAEKFLKNLPNECKLFIADKKPLPRKKA
jgi:hypothetical protein